MAALWSASNARIIKKSQPAETTHVVAAVLNQGWEDRATVTFKQDLSAVEREPSNCNEQRKKSFV
jgi:hypothetical protein